MVKYAKGENIEYDYYRTDGTKSETPDILMWVGAQFYTVKDFLDEVRTVGLSKRVAGVPDALVFGSTRLFLAHPEAIENEAWDPADKDSKRFLPGIFALTVIEQVELILDKNNPKAKEKWEKLRKMGVTPVAIEVARVEQERGCGFRKVGAIYLVASPDMEKIIEVVGGKALDIKGGISEISPPTPYPEGKSNRTITWVDGDAIMEERPPEEWKLNRVRLVKTIPRKCRDGIHRKKPVEKGGKWVCPSCGQDVKGPPAPVIVRMDAAEEPVIEMEAKVERVSIEGSGDDDWMTGWD